MCKERAKKAFSPSIHKLAEYDHHHISVSKRQACSAKIIGHLEFNESSLIIILVLTSSECLFFSLFFLYFCFVSSCRFFVRLMFQSYGLMFVSFVSKWGQVLHFSLLLVCLFISWLFLKCPIYSLQISSFLFGFFREYNDNIFAEYSIWWHELIWHSD